MNYMLQIHGERSLCQVPPGLYELMSDISREVLRDQPDQIYSYIAHYLDILLTLRTDMKTASEVVNDVIADNVELIAYVKDRGTTLEEANKYARIIQRAFRRLKARQELQQRIRMNKEQLGKAPPSESSSIREFLECLGTDYETANKASSTIQSAFKTFIAKKQMDEMVRCSTHSISMVQPIADVPVPLVFEKPIARNSKLQVYEESPSPSIISGWYKPVSDETAGAGKETRPVATSTIAAGPVQIKAVAGELFVFEDSTRPSIDTVWYAAQGKVSDASVEARRLGLTKGMSCLEREDSTPNPSLEYAVPTYFEVDQSKVPMVSESGQLEEDVVTLFSTDTYTVKRSLISLSEGDHSRGEGSEKLPSLQDVGSRKPSKTEAEAAKELISVIGRKFSDNKSSINKSAHLVSVNGNPSSSPKSRSILKDTASRKSEDVKRNTVTNVPSNISNKDELEHHPSVSSRMMKMHVKLSSYEMETEESP